MARLLSWLGKQAQGAVAQVNPWDGGANYNSVMRQHEEEERKRSQPQQAPPRYYSQGLQLNRPQAQQQNNQPQQNLQVRRSPLQQARLISQQPTQQQNNPQRSGLVANDINKLFSPRVQEQIRKRDEEVAQAKADIFNPLKIAGDIGNAAKGAYKASEEFVRSGEDGRNFGENAGDLFAGNAARLYNTGKEGAVDPIVGLLQGKSEAEVKKELNRDLYSNKGGALDVGTFFANDKSTVMNPLDFGKKFAGAGIGAATEIAPALRGTSLLLKPGLKTGQKVLRGGLEGAAYGGAGTAGMQLANGEELDAKQIALGTAVGAAIGGGIPSLGYAAPVAKKGAKVANDARPAEMAKRDPRVRGYDDAINQLQQRYDIEQNTLVRHQLNKAITVARTEQQATYGQVRRELSQGGFATVPFGKDPDPISTNFYKEQVASYNNPKEFVDKTVADIWERNKTAQGVDSSLIPDEYGGGYSGRASISNNTPFYQDFYKEYGHKPTKKEITELVKREINGEETILSKNQEMTPFDKDIHRELADRDARLSQKVDDSSGETAGTPKETSQRKQIAAPQQGVATATKVAKSGKGIGSLSPFAKDNTIKPNVKQAASRDKQIPVRQMTKDGDTVTATNVNKSIKSREKRYTVDKDGDLIEDKKGATSLFTNKDGTVKGFRVGKDYFDKSDLGDLSTVNGYGSTVATMRRNVERAFDEKTGNKVNEFLVDHQQKQATKLIDRQVKLNKGMKEIADDLDISFGVGSKKAKKVSAAIQDFGEKGRTRKNLIDEFGEPTANKIVKADKWFRKQYDDMLTEMNTTLEQFGYDPVPKRKNYYTHFQDENLWKKFGLKMQEIRDLSSPTMQDASPTAARGSISNKLAGLSEQTAPNKAFNKFALQRKGDKHTSDAFKSFEAYMNPTLNNIYMTPSIARARALARAIAQDADIVGKDANKTIVQLREWGNNLAGKSNRFDRPLLDTTWGSRTVKAFGWAQKKAGQNTIVGNLSTAVLQPVVLAQTAGKFGYKNTLLGMADVINPSKRSAIKRSEFMRRRYSDLAPVTSTKIDRARKVANKPLEIVEQTSAEITWHSAHNDALSKGMDGKKAIQYADVATEKTMAGRSIGERPELYRSKAAGPFTMYQLEVNNYWQQMGKEFTKTQAAKALVAAYGLNIMFNEVIGRDVGLNPIGAAIDVYDEFQKDEKEMRDKVKSAGQRVVGEAADNIPIIPQVATTLFGEKNYKGVVGEDSQGGRFGVSSPLSTLVSNPEYILSPFGGSQIKKTFKAGKALLEGKMTNKDGDTTVNIPQNIGNAAKGLLFGPAAIPEVGQYYNNLGKRKVDQKTVQNQSQSIAATQGLNGLTKKQQELLATATNERKPTLRDEMIAENKAKRVEQSQPSTPLTDSQKEQKKIDSKVDRYVNGSISAKSKDTLTKYYSMDTKSRDKWFSTQNDAEYKYWQAKYENDKAEGKISKVDEVKWKYNLAKDRIGSKYSKDSRDALSLSKEKVSEYISSTKNPDKVAREIYDYDKRLYQEGVSKYRKFKKGLTYAVNTKPSSKTQTTSYAQQAAKKNNIPENIFAALIQQESGGNQNAVSPVGAQGLTQLMPATAKGLGVDPNDPKQNLEGGARYLATQYKKFGSWELALAAYNAGPGAVQQYGGIPPYPETQNYVKTIMGNLGAASLASITGGGGGLVYKTIGGDGTITASTTPPSSSSGSRTTSSGSKSSGGRSSGGSGGSRGNGITAGKALVSLVSSTNKLQAPKTTGGSKANTKLKMKQTPLRKYTVADAKYSSKPVKITSRKTRE